MSMVEHQLETMCDLDGLFFGSSMLYKLLLLSAFELTLLSASWWPSKRRVSLVILLLESKQ